jgi:hypothetical protein
MKELKDLNNEIQTLSDSSVEHRRLTRAFFKIYTCVVNTYNAIKSIRLKLGTLESKSTTLESSLANTQARVTNNETEIATLRTDLDTDMKIRGWEYYTAPWNICFYKQGRIVTVQIWSDGSSTIANTNGTHVIKLSGLEDALRPLASRINIITDSVVDTGVKGEWVIEYKNGTTVMKLKTTAAYTWSLGSSAYVSYV